MKASFMVGADTKDDTATNNGGGGIRNVRRHLDRWPEDYSLRVVVDDDYNDTTAVSARGRRQGSCSSRFLRCRGVCDFCSRMYEQWTYIYECRAKYGCVTAA